MAVHEVKVYPGVFRAAKQGLRTLEVLEDTGFAVGDELLYREWDAAEDDWTGDTCSSVIRIIARGPDDGLNRGTARLSVERLVKPLNVVGDLAESRRRRDALKTEDL